MRGAILTVAGGVFSLILSANQGYAGAAKTGCTTISPGSGTPNTCGVQVPTGTQQVDPPGNIVNPDTTFEAGPINGFEVGSGTGNGTGTSFNSFLGFFSGGPASGYNNDFNGNKPISNSPTDFAVIEFDGTFTITGPAVFDICYNAGSSVELFIDGNDVPLSSLGPSGSSCSIDPFDTASPTLTPGLHNFVLDYYAGVGDPDTEDTEGYALSATVNGTPLDDSLPGGTVPEPASLSLFAAGLAGVGLLRRRRKRG